MAEANYCYLNSSIYFNSHIANEDLEEFAIHECIHFLQEIRDDNNKVIKMGLSSYNKFKTKGAGLNEAAVQYISAKIIGIQPDFEKYYDINIFTPSPSYYPIECALLNELIFFLGEKDLFSSTYFSTDDFKNSIISYTSKKTFEKIQLAFDNILKYEEKIIILNNKVLNTDSSNHLQEEITKIREKITNTFIQTQNLIIQDFFNQKYNNIATLEDLENCRKSLNKFKTLIGSIDNYTFFESFYEEMMNRLAYKTSILENGSTDETALVKKRSLLADFFNKIRYMLFYREVKTKQ